MLACRSLRAVSARLGLGASLSLAAVGGALAQDHYDAAGTKVPAFVLLDGCLSEGACAGPNGAGNPLFVAPATGASWGMTAAPGAFADGWSVTEGTKVDSAYTGAGSASVVALLKGLYGNLAATAANQPALSGDGGALAHVTNFPATQPVSAAALPLPSGAATATNQPALNGDGGALAHVTNFPATQPVNETSPSTVGDGVVTGGVATDTVNSGGSGYVAGDVGKTVNVVGGTYTTQAQVTISAVSGGAVTAVTLANAGVYSSTSGTGATAGGGTAGSGLTLYLGFAPIAQTLFGGTAPADGWKIVNPNASGDIWASDNGTTPAANGASSYRCAASGGACKTEPGEKPPGSPVQLLGAAIGAPFIARRW